MDIFDLIRTRRSIRRFKNEPVSDDTIDRIMEAGTWAPSGLNNQPWRFTVIRDAGIKTEMATLTRYSKIVRDAQVLITVFLDHSLSYDRTKDAQAVGACIQNMLLTVHAMGLGAVWLGEILKNKDRVRELAGAAHDHELMAVIALGVPAENGGKGKRKPLDEVIISRK